jgi:hypothetical protein
VAGQNPVVDWKITVGNKTVPDLVIAFALAVKVTPVRPENRLHVGLVCHLAAERDKLFAVGNQTDRHFADRATHERTVRFEQLWDYDGAFFCQSLNGVGFGDEPGYIVASRDPDYSLLVPFSIYCDLFCSHFTMSRLMTSHLSNTRFGNVKSAMV